jgi:hypothetical protein
MWDENSTPNSLRTTAAFFMMGASDWDPKIMAAFIV